jgi:hypothetical protein
MKKINSLLIILACTFIVSCESNTYNDIAVITTNPTYTKNIAPVIKANCISCHAGNSQSPNLETYTEVKEATQIGDLICRIDQTPGLACGRVMPQSGPMSKQTINMIILWNSQGCIN